MPAPQLADLSERELDVFRRIARGLSNAEIGERLYISDTTVKRTSQALARLAVVAYPA
jgi:DNA-binding NarL/FixJ family response regulator